MTYKGLTIEKKGKRLRIVSTTSGTVYGSAPGLVGIADVIARFYYDDAANVLTALRAQEG